MTDYAITCTSLLVQKSILPGQMFETIARAWVGFPTIDARTSIVGSDKLGKSALHADPADRVVRELSKGVAHTVLNNSALAEFALPRASTSPRFVSYSAGDHYDDHVDSALLSDPPIRGDLAATLALNSPDEYDGGALVIRTINGEQAYRLDANTCIVYSANTVHRVEPVIRGERRVAIFWLQSLVRDPTRRSILAELARVARDSDELARPRLTSIHQSLLRLWVEL